MFWECFAHAENRISQGLILILPHPVLHLTFKHLNCETHLLNIAQKRNHVIEKLYLFLV